MFEDRTTENLKKETLAEISPELGISTMAGSYADAVVGPLAQAVSRLYKALPAVVSMLFIDPGSGPFIDLVAQDYHSLTRREGTKARCGIVLTGKAGTVVPAGTVFLTASGLRFVLLEPVAIPQSGARRGRWRRRRGGGVQRAPGRHRPDVPQPAWPGGLCQRPGRGGTDRESDEALYLRVVEARQRPATSGNGWDYRRWALAVEGVGEVKVTELREGPGTVGLTLTDSRFRSPGAEIVKAVRNYIEEHRPVGALALVEAAQEVPVRVEARVITLGTTAQAVKEELEERLEEQFRRMIRTKCQTICYKPEEDRPYTLLYNRVLTLLLSIDGVDTFTLLTVNGGEEDIVIPADAIPVLDGVVVT